MVRHNVYSFTIHHFFKRLLYNVSFLIQDGNLAYGCRFESKHCLKGFRYMYVIFYFEFLSLALNLFPLRPIYRWHIHLLIEKDYRCNRNLTESLLILAWKDSIMCSSSKKCICSFTSFFWKQNFHIKKLVGLQFWFS